MVRRYAVGYWAGGRQILGRQRYYTARGARRAARRLMEDGLGNGVGFPVKVTSLIADPGDDEVVWVPQRATKEA